MWLNQFLKIICIFLRAMQGEFFHSPGELSKLQKLKDRAFANPKVKAEYDALSDEFDLIGQLIEMRIKAGLPQSNEAR